VKSVVTRPDAIAVLKPPAAAAAQASVKFVTRPVTSGIASCRLVAGCAAPSAARERAFRGDLAAMDDIDVTSSMGSELPWMFNIVEVATLLGCERNFPHTQVPRSGACGRRALRIGRSLRVLRDELLMRFGFRRVVCSFARVGGDAAPRPRPDAGGAGDRGGSRRRPGVRRGSNESVGRAGSPRLVPPPDQIPLLPEI
jgi:hypothetical protein